MSRIKSKVRDKRDIVKQCVKASAYLEKSLKAERQRAVEFANELKERNMTLEYENHKLKDDIQRGQEIIEGLRDRIYKLMCSVNDDCRVAGIEPIREIDPGEEGWWPKDGLFEQSGDMREESGDKYEL